jgi:hypothetical protein
VRSICRKKARTRKAILERRKTRRNLQKNLITLEKILAALVRKIKNLILTALEKILADLVRKRKIPSAPEKILAVLVQKIILKIKVKTPSALVQKTKIKALPRKRNRAKRGHHTANPGDLRSNPRRGPWTAAIPTETPMPMSMVGTMGIVC